MYIGYNAGMNDSIYLDHNATTPLLPEVAEAVRDAAVRYRANPASQHHLGQAARRALETARDRISELLGAKTNGMDPDRLVFTSGGTEANNLALLGMLAHLPPGHLITSAMEHSSILRPVEELERRGWQVSRAGAEQRGIVRVDELEACFRSNTRLVCIQAANNETGVLQPITEISAICRRHSVPLMSDACQLVGKLPVLFTHWGLAALSCAAHKFHGPLGIGALLLRGDIAVQPRLFGGHQQAGVRPGTESVALAVGMQVALECWRRDAEPRTRHLAALKTRFVEQLCAGIPSAVVIGHDAPRLPNTACIAFPGIDRQAFFLALDTVGIACSTGSACASGSSEPSPTLLAMELAPEQVASALRFSWGATTEIAEIDEGCRRILNAYNELCRLRKC